MIFPFTPHAEDLDPNWEYNGKPKVRPPVMMKLRSLLNPLRQAASSELGCAPAQLPVCYLLLLTVGAVSAQNAAAEKPLAAADNSSYSYAITYGCYLRTGRPACTVGAWPAEPASVGLSPPQAALPCARLPPPHESAPSQAR